MEIHLLAHGPPAQHERFKEWVLKKKYPFNSAREGYNRPFISETRLYTVKLKKECVPMFLADLKASTQEISGRKGHVHGAVNGIMKWVLRIMKLFPKVQSEADKIVDVNMKKVKAGNDDFAGWFYTKVLFANNDVTKIKDGIPEEEL